MKVKRKLRVVLTDECNFNCRNCYNEFNDTRNNHNELNPDSLLKYINKNKNSISSIVLTGGYLSEIIKKIHCLNIPIQVTTNGIDNVKFKINKKTLFVEKIIPGKQTQEISQFFLFNKKDSNLIYELNIQNMSRFDILYKILLPNSNLCVHNCNKECYNINEFSDYEEVRRKYENI